MSPQIVIPAKAGTQRTKTLEMPCGAGAVICLRWVPAFGGMTRIL